MDVVRLAAAELFRIRAIDRAERAEGYFVHEQGGLRRIERALEIPTWDDAELAGTLERLSRALAEGGVLLGVEDGATLAGAAVLGAARLRGERRRLELVFLHVGRPYRRRGLARLLFAEVCRRARQQAAEELYVSSSDVESAVWFYLGQGCVPAEPVDPQLVARWPTDIQLTFAL